MEHHITIPSGDLELAATLHYPTDGEDADCRGGAGKWPVVIICHGFIGNRIGVDRLFVKTARALSSQGYMVLRFDYGGCGESTGDYGAGGLDPMIAQTRRVLDYALSLDCVDPGSVTLLGHSLGGAVALLTAASDHRVRTLVMWSAVAHPHNDIVRIVGKEAYRQLEPDKGIDYQGYLLTPAFFDSLSKHQPFEQLRKFGGDVLIAHGTADEDIPVDYAPLYQKMFWLRADGRCDLELIFQADHTFSNRDATFTLIGKTSAWLVDLQKRKKEWYDWMI
ncbi:alpha/beta hydrolase family protein [Paenibacillus sp. RC84]|uniref:alpha/beta hydrolase family protein n=1 Tax=Paenibacillus sp. RC84 TaxID=3156252 RepID=UPI003519A729